LGARRSAECRQTRSSRCGLWWSHAGLLQITAVRPARCRVQVMYKPRCAAIVAAHLCQRGVIVAAHLCQRGVIEDEAPVVGLRGPEEDGQKAVPPEAVVQAQTHPLRRGRGDGPQISDAVGSSSTISGACRMNPRETATRCHCPPTAPSRR